ncbi:MAG: hypothetical protein AAF914_07040 [Pseudomonadota bacterium]
MDGATGSAVPATPGDGGLSEWLAERPVAECGALAYRAAMRALPEAALVARLGEEGAAYALMAVRAALTAGAMSAAPSETLTKRAARVAKGSAAARRVHAALTREGLPAAEAMVRAISAVEAAAAAEPGAAADMALHAMLGDEDAIEDFALAPETLLTAPIDVTVEDGAAEAGGFAEGADWAFWRAWYEAALEGAPVDWAIQSEIAALPEEAWQAGPAVVAGRIARILAREDLMQRIRMLSRRMDTDATPDPAETGAADGAVEPAEGAVAASFGAIRLLREPVEVLVSQTQSPQPQPYLIQKAIARLTNVVAASGKWLGRASEVHDKDMVRAIGKGGGVATAAWIDTQAEAIRAVAEAADEWMRRLPA